MDNLGDGDSSLHSAARRRDTAWARRLLEAGADVDSRNSSGQTPLQLACLRGCLATVKLLLQFGADVEARGGNRMQATPLIFAMMSGNEPGPAVVETLVSLGADVNATMRIGRSALHVACLLRSHRLQAVPLLLDAGAEVNSADQNGDTPLHLITRRYPHLHRNNTERDREQWLEAARILLAHGADVDATNNGGETPLVLAGEFDDMLQLLLDSRSENLPDYDSE